MITSFLKKMFLVLFLDLFAYSTIMPLLPILFLDSECFLLGLSRDKRLFFLGAVYATYPMFQMLFSPLWIKKADKMGRAWMLKISFVGNCLGYIISSLAVVSGQVYLLFLGNAISGALGVNLSTMNALISDSSSGPKRVKYFGVINLMLGSAFAVGPYLSSLMVDYFGKVETVAFFVFSLAALFAAVNFLLVSSLKKPIVVPQSSGSKLDFKQVRKEAFMPLFMIFLTTFGWYLFIKTFQVHLIESKGFDSASVLKLVAFYGFSTLLAQAAFVTKIYKRFHGRKSLGLSLLGLALSIALFIINPGAISLHLHMLAIAFFQSMIGPNLLAVFSQQHTSEVHGQMMSAHLGVASSAKILAPLVSGLVVSVSTSLAISISCVVFLVAFALSPYLLRQPAPETSASL